MLIVLNLEAGEGVGFESVPQLSATAASADEQPLLRYDVEGLGEETCMVLTELYRRQKD